MNELTTTNNQLSTTFSVGDYYQAFLGSLDVMPKTKETYLYNLKPFFSFLRDNSITQPTRETVLAYRDFLKETKKPSTVQAYLAVVRVFFDFTETQGLYPNIAKRVKGAKVSKEFKKDYLTVDQLKEVVAPIDQTTESGARDFAIVSLMAVCGLRTVEVSRANIEDLKPLGGKTVLFVQGKGQEEKSAFVIVPQAVEKAIRTYLTKRGKAEQDAPLFASTSNNNKGGRLTTVSVSNIAKQAMVSAGFASERLTAHSLRHSAITNAILAGNSLQDTQSFARHANIATTMIYNHSVDKMKNQCAESVASAIFG